MLRPPGTKSPPEHLDFDDVGAFAELVRAREAGARRDWPAFVAAYEAAGCWALRRAAVLAFVAVDGIDELLRRTAEADPESTLCRTVLAVRAIHTGWAIRTAKRAQYVSQEQFEAFHAHLRRAEQQLIEVTAREPDNLVAWTARLTTARGLQLGQAEARRRYDQLAKHDPHYLPAQSQLLQQLCRKWRGDAGQMLAFARERAFAAPPGSLNGQLIVDAHWEHSGDLEGDQGWQHLRNPEVRAEVDRAAAHSVLHPACRPVHNWIHAHGMFAFYYSLIGDHAAAAPHFRATGSRVSLAMWSASYDDAEARCRADRAKALAKG